MNHWRISKYNPALRDQYGIYGEPDWTSVSDIDKVFNGNKLTYMAYMQIENAYIHAVHYFLSDSSISFLEIAGFEAKTQPELRSVLHQYHLDQLLDKNIIFYDGQHIDLSGLEMVCRLNLRESIWCKLEQIGVFYIHFGYDYYMYIGSHKNCATAIQLTQAEGLYVEPKVSPYLSNTE